ncbi:50S ribosomal protein L9 [Candidatus Nomurabacteria bacterium]|nr:50S ribosomal protein L9 [Candidatus Nomurabacteria bacterium]
MKVILLKDVRNVGQIGTVCDVADGFARNYLFAHKLAEPATEEKIAQVAAQAEARAEEAKKQAAELDSKVKSLNGKTVTIPARATEKGGLFKAITPRDVAKAIRAEHSLEIPEDSIVIAVAIKTVGVHTIELQNSAHKKVPFSVSVSAQ